MKRISTFLVIISICLALFGQTDSPTPNPYLLRLFIPLKLYDGPLKLIAGWPFKIAQPDTLLDLSGFGLPFDIRKYQTIKRTNDRVDRLLADTYKKYPQWVHSIDGVDDTKTLLPINVRHKVQPKTSILDLFKPDSVLDDVGSAELTIKKPNFWTKGGNSSLQFSQNYISKNWYKGGESAQYLQGAAQFFSNYDDKSRIQFENLFEAKVGFNTVPSDTVREYRVGTDVFRIFSKLGLLAKYKWYYTISAEFNTQFFTNYTVNTNDVASAFMAPANFTFSVGMDYKLQNDKINLSVMLMPLAYNWRFIADDRVDETAFGIDPGKSSLHDFGSKVQTTIAWKVISSITVNSRIYYFTNYEKVEAEWENTIDFALNRYLSTKLFVHARYYDDVARVEGKSYWQLNELLSFGLNYKW